MCSHEFSDLDFLFISVATLLEFIYIAGVVTRRYSGVALLQSASIQISIVMCGEGMKRLFVLAASITALSGCGDSAERDALRVELDELKGQLQKATTELSDQKHQLALLETERDELKLKVEDLSQTASVIYAEVQALLKDAQLADATSKLGVLREKFPLSPELVKAQKEVAELENKIQKLEEEKKRLATLGFLGLATPGSIKNSEINVSLGQASTQKQFVFDRYDNSYHYFDADRDSKYVVLSMGVTASKGVTDPKLFGFAAYVADGDNLEKLADLDVRLARWSDYASYLGNYSDSRNDFAKTSKINFNLGVQVSDEDLKRRPIYIVAQTTGCLQRGSDRFGNPPVSYSGYCEHLRSKLKLDDFSGDSPSVALVRRFG